MAECKKCSVELTEKQVEYCSIVCAKEDNPGKRKVERICSGCEKIEYVSNYNQRKRQCRSCSKMGNVSSRNRTRETREKIAAAKRGVTPWNKGKTGVYSQKTKKAMGAKNKGRKYTQEQSENHKQGLLNYYKEHEHHNKGGTLTPSHKEKIKTTLRKTSHKKIKETLKDAKTLCKKLGLNLVTEDDENIKIKQTDKIEIKCKCENIYTTDLNRLKNGVNLKCSKCSGIGSRAEDELFEFIRSIYSGQILRRKRPTFMNGLELDIYLPGENLALEYHGLAHHSERPVFEVKDLSRVKTQHEEKYFLCKEAGVKLIQIFEDEWRDKRPILESMIKSNLNICEEKIGARKLNFEQVDGKDPKIVEFFENTHIKGHVNGICTFLLTSDEGEIYSALSIKKPWFAKKGEKPLEIARFSNKLNTQVTGSFQRLMKMAKLYMELQGFNTIYAFSDCRFGHGQVYLEAGFEHLKHRKPDYFYEKGGIRESRLKHRKSKKLKGETEREQQNNLDWYAIYDAGEEKFRLDLATAHRFRTSRVKI